MIGLGFVPCVRAQSVIDAETGIVIPGYNDVAVPGGTGTRFSLTDDLDAEKTVAFRLRFSRTFSGRHWVGILVAPLTMKSRGVIGKSVYFNGTTFPKGSTVDARFRFDSYRLIYRYKLRRADTFQFSIGGAVNVRDAAIQLESGTLRSVKKNTGLVPLLSLNLTWEPAKKVHFLIDGEALVAPQGRAEDVLFAAQYQVSNSVALKAGYRLLEGGADNNEVYTFSLFHYIVVGATWSFGNFPHSG